jgi:peptidoglycan/xylan/chitin deacetylase (PgdA/CDA1 family)
MVPGVRDRFEPEDDAIALTFDLCGGEGEGGVDRALLELARAEGIPVALFVSGRWARAHEGLVRHLAAEPLFSIENHGLEHRPCSVSGRGAFGIRGTRDIRDAVAEIHDNARLLASLTGRAPRYYRPGTAHLDDVCAEASAMLSEVPLGFTVAGDGGASYSARAVRDALVRSKPGSIVLLHANRPRSKASDGLRAALPALRARGVRFVRLDDAFAGADRGAP